MKKEIDLDISEFTGLEVIEAGDGCIVFNKGNLNVECAWRLRNTHGILVSGAEYKSERTRDKADRIFKEELLGASIAAIKIHMVPCDIIIEFDNQLFLDLFPQSTLFESWELKRNEGIHLIGLPGGQLTWFLKKDE